MENATRKFKYIGFGPNDTRPKSFVVVVEEEEFKRISKFPYPKTMRAEVIESKNPGRYVGENVDLCNPYYEMNYCGWPVFVAS